MKIRNLFFLFFPALLNGCGALSTGKFPFQERSAAADKCPTTLRGYSYSECLRKNYWGYNSAHVSRFREQVFIAGFKFQDLTIRSEDATVLGSRALLYGIAKETLNFGATHFKILPKEKYVDMRRMPATVPQLEIRGRISGDTFTGTGSLIGGGGESYNHDAKGITTELQVLAYFTVASNPECQPAKCDDNFEMPIKKIRYKSAYELPMSFSEAYWVNAKGLIEVFEEFIDLR
jgi:hypothetical protein